jgi:hypothetical protein
MRTLEPIRPPDELPSVANSVSYIVSHEQEERPWLVICPQWAELISRHYASDIEAGWALKADPKVLSKLRSGTPVAKSTVLKMFRHYASRHGLGSATADLVVDTRTR